MVCFIPNRKKYENSTKDFCSIVDQTPILFGEYSVLDLVSYEFSPFEHRIPALAGNMPDKQTDFYMN